MDIGSKAEGAAGALSNFTPRRFIFDGIECNSIEGALQAFKFSNPDSQKSTCLLVGLSAKRKGRGRNKYWQARQELYWNGQIYKRKSKEYQHLLDRLYQAVYDQDESLRDTLANTHKAVFTHSMGNPNEKETVLTTREFCSRLTKLRDTGKLVA